MFCICGGEPEGVELEATTGLESGLEAGAWLGHRFAILSPTPFCNERPQFRFGRPQRGWGASVGGEQAVRAQIWRVTEAQSTDLLCGTNPSQRTIECWWWFAMPNCTRCVTPRFGNGNDDVRVSRAPRGCLAMARQTYGAHEAWAPKNHH